MAQEIFCIRRSRHVDCVAEVVKGHNYVPVVCPVNPDHSTTRLVRGPITIDPEESGTTECLWTWMSDCLLNEAVIEEMRSAGFTGFTTDPVEMTNSSRIGLTYAQFRAIGWGGMAPAESGIRLTYRCEHCLRLRYSALLRPERLFDEKNWDGSDVFMIWPLSAFKFVVGRVAELMRDLRVTGIDLVPIKDLDTGKDGFGPGRLSYSMPVERAVAIGRPLGIE